MAEDFRHWQDEGPEDLRLPAEIDPLLELAAEIALCTQGIEEHRGSFCTACTCQLGYHLSCDDGVCELCCCEEIYWYCIKCGQSRPIECYMVGSKECNYCTKRLPVMIKPDNVKVSSLKSRWDFTWSNALINRERSKDARAALKELTE